MTVPTTFRLRVLTFTILVFSLTVVISSFATYGADQHIELARSLLLGRLDLVKLPENLSDVIFYNNRYYWPLPPLHVFLFVPFVFLFGVDSNIIYGPLIHIATNSAVFYFAYRLSQRILTDEGKGTHLLLAFAFCFSTVMHLNFTVAWIYYTLHSLCVLFILLCIYGRLNKFHPLVTGAAFALAFLSRYNILVALPFFLYGYFSVRDLKNALYFLAPLFVAICMVGYYNYARFGKPWDFGYAYANNFTTPDNLLYELKEKGIFKISNMPTNFYYYFIKTLDPVREEVQSYFGQTHYLKFPYVRVDYPGTSFFVVSPIMLLVFKFRPKSREDWVLLANTLLMVVLLLTYYWSGWVQIGPRYMSDVLPFLYIMLLKVMSMRGVKNSDAVLIYFSACFNLFLISNCR